MAQFRLENMKKPYSICVYIYSYMQLNLSICTRTDIYIHTCISSIYPTYKKIVCIYPLVLERPDFGGALGSHDPLSEISHDMVAIL